MKKYNSNLAPKENTTLKVANANKVNPKTVTKILLGHSVGNNAATFHKPINSK